MYPYVGGYAAWALAYSRLCGRGYLYRKKLLLQHDGVVITAFHYAQEGTRGALTYSIKNTQDMEVEICLGRLFINGHEINTVDQIGDNRRVAPGETAIDFVEIDLNYLSVLGEKKLNTIGLGFLLKSCDAEKEFESEPESIQLKTNKQVKNSVNLFNVKLCNMSLLHGEKLAVGLCLLLSLVLLLARKRRILARDITALLYAFPVLICIGWIYLLSNHAVMHILFVYRTIAPTVFCLMCMIWGLAFPSKAQ